MNEGLKYLQKNNINNKKVEILLKEFKILYSYDGIICKKCGIMQWKENKKLGIKKYYCDCIYNKVNKEIKKEIQKIMVEILDFIISPLDSEDD